MNLFYIFGLSVSVLGNYSLTEISISSNFDKVDRLEGSVEGGTALYFRGTWPLSDTSDFQIAIGSSECKIEESYEKQLVVACVTPPQPSSSQDFYPITVVFKNIELEAASDVDPVFYYTESKSPTLLYPSPSEAVPGDEVLLVSESDSAIFTEVRIEGKLAVISNDTPFTILVGPNYHGDSELTVRFPGGQARQNWIGLQTNAKGERYNFQVLSKILFVDKNKAGNFGGLPITIRGEGFRDSQVDISGSPCEVTYEDYHRIDCVTGAQSFDANQQFFEGGAGLVTDIWLGRSGLNISELVDETPAITRSTAVTGVRQVFSQYATSRTYGLLKVPYDGLYTFYVSGLGTTNLYLSTDMNPDNAASILENVSELPSRQYFLDERRQSNQILLAKDVAYYIEIHTYSEFDLNVGLETPLGDSAPGNEMPLVQRLEKLFEQTDTIDHPGGKFIIDIFDSDGPPAGGRLNFNVETDEILITEYVYWDQNQGNWPCSAIVNVFDLISSTISCDTWVTEEALVIEITVTEDVQNIEPDTTFVRPHNNIDRFDSVNHSVRREHNTEEIKIEYQLAFKNQVSSTISMTADARTLQEQLNSEIADFMYELVVESYDLDGRSFFYFMLPGSEFAGDVIELITNGASVSKSTLEVIKSPGNSRFWWAIPSSFLHTIENQPQVRVSTDSSYGICKGSCGFNYVGVDPIVSFTQSSNVLTLYKAAEAFQSLIDVSITVGNAPCTLKNVFFDRYECAVSPGEAGDHQPVVFSDVLGIIPISPEFTDTISFRLIIKDLDPSTGGTQGGTYLTLEGNGFPVSVERATVTIGDSPCQVHSTSFKELTCVTSAQTTDSVLSLTVNDVTVTTDKFQYDESYNVVIARVSPQYAKTVFPTNITITGSNFGNEIEKANVKIGDEECFVLSLEDDQIICRFLGGPAGEYDLVVYIDGVGKTFREKYPIVFRVDEMTPQFGSIHGGTLITFKGLGFSSDWKAHRVVIQDTSECEVVEVPDEYTLICRTGPLPPELEADKNYKVQVIARLQEIALSDTTYTWSTYRSPYVEDITPQMGSHGTEITLTGHGFGEFDGGATLLFNEVPAEIVSVENFEIIAIVPQVQGPTPTLALHIEDRGNAHINPTFFTPFWVTGMDVREISRAGGFVKVFGSGFHLGMSVHFGDHVCALTSVSDSFFECKLEPSDASGLQLLHLEDSTQTFQCENSEICGLSFLLSQTPIVSNYLRIDGDFRVDIQEVGGEVVLENYPCLITESSMHHIKCIPVAPNGNYPVSIRIDNYGYALGDYIFAVRLSVDPIPLRTSSFAGGQRVNIEGSGLSLNNAIYLCGVEAEIISSGGFSTEFIIPPLPTLFSQTEVALISPDSQVSQFNPISSNPQAALLGLDGNKETFFTDQSTDKWLGIDVGDGRAVQLHKVNVLGGGSSLKNFQTLGGSQIQAKKEGGDWETLFTYDHVDDFENLYKVPPGSSQIYRYFRVYKEAAEDEWAINEFQVFGVLLLNNIAEIVNCDLVVSAPDGTSKTVENVVQYSFDQTPVLKDLSPKLGSVKGGDILTLTGTGFGSSTEAVNVTIDTIPCDVLTVSDSEITCLTTARSAYMEPSLTIWVDGKGYAATQGLTFLYSERWSDPETWGGMLPKAQDSVFIASGQVVILDVPTPILGVIAIEGTLIVEDLPGLSIQAEIIEVHYGKLIIGTEEEPFLNNLDITLHGGIDSRVATVFGNKMILVISGSIDIHGKKRTPTWTYLSQSAVAGDTWIELDEDIDWEAGETIAIAPSGFNYEEGEKKQIVSVDNRRVELDSPLAHDHNSSIEDYNGRKIDKRTEVALLSRNIRILPSDEDLADRFYGSHVLMSVATEPVNGRIEYVEFYKAGQAFRRLKYPLHFHIPGIVTNSYARGNSFHECYNRAITVHGTEYATIEDNVAFDIMGHTYFIEDGNELKNVFRRNLGIYTKPSFSLLNSDRTPATFKISNALNFFYDNRAAGSESYGFWFEAPVSPPNFNFGDAPEVLCPQFAQLGAFINNSAHSNGKHGLLIEPRVTPLTEPCLPAVDQSKKDWWSTNPAIPATMHNFTAFHNPGRGVEVHEIGDVSFNSFNLADNLQGGILVTWSNFSEPYKSATISNALVVGKGNVAHSEDLSHFVGIVTPQTDGLAIENVDFWNILDDMHALGDSAFSEFSRVADYGARVHKLSGLSFNNSHKRIKWNVPYRGIYEILDDSLTGNPGDFVTPSWPHLQLPDCSLSSSLNATVCSGRKIRRVHLHSLTPLERFVGQDIYIYGLSDTASPTPISTFPMITTNLKKDIKYSWAIPFATGYTYNVWWGEAAIPWTGLKIEIDTFEAEEEVTLVFNMNEQRDSYTGKRGISPVGILPDPTLLVSKWPDELSSGDYSGTFTWDDHSFSILLSGIAANSYQFNDIEITSQRCPDSGCVQLPDISLPSGSITTRNWSANFGWPSGAKPREGDSVIINADEIVILDETTPILKYLEVNGELIFSSTRSVTLHSEMIFIRSGAIRSGTAENPTPEDMTHIIDLHGNSNDFVLPGAEHLDLGSQLLLNTGTLELFGNPTTAWTKLEQDAEPGEDFVFVRAVDWPTSVYATIAPTGFDKSEAETLRIQTIDTNVSNDSDWLRKQAERGKGKAPEPDLTIERQTTTVSASEVIKINFDRNLNHYHSGSALVIDGKTVDMRGEIGLLRRNIRIRGNSGACSILTTSFTDNNFEERTGYTILDNVETNFCGHPDSERAALRFENNPGGASSVSNSLIARSPGWGLFINAANNVSFKSNMIDEATWRGVVVKTTSNTEITGNLVLNLQSRTILPPETDKNAAFYACVEYQSCSNTLISGNVAAGYPFAGFIVSENMCGSPQLLKDNIAHSGYVGWILANPRGVCVQSSHFSSFFNELGIGTITPVRELLFDSLIFAENKLGMALRSGINSDDIIPYVFAQNVTNSVFIGTSHHSFCDDSDCTSSDCGPRVGFYTGFADYKQVTVDYYEGIDLPITKQRESAYSLGQAFYDNILLGNYRHEPSCGNEQYAFQTNPENPDYTLPHFLSNFTKIRVGDENLMLMNAPQETWATAELCGDFPCTGLKNVLIEDLDNSVIGLREGISNNGGVIIYNSPGIANSELCELRTSNNAYFCYYEENQSEFYVNYVYEETFGVGFTTSPVNIKASDFGDGLYENALNGFMDHDYNGIARARANLRRFPALIYTGLHYNLSFYGTQAIFGRCYLQGTLGRNVSVSITHNIHDSRVYAMFQNSTIIPDVSIVKGEKRYPQLTDPHGTNRWYYGDLNLEVILRNQEFLDIEVTGDIRSDGQVDYFVGDFSENLKQYSYIDLFATMIRVKAYRVQTPVFDVTQGLVDESLFDPTKQPSLE